MKFYINHATKGSVESLVGAIVVVALIDFIKACYWDTSYSRKIYCMPSNMICIQVLMVNGYQMIRRQELVSILVSATVFLVIYLSLHWKYVTVSDLDSLITAFVVAGTILVWGFKERIELLLKGPKEPIHKKEEQELMLLISQLYAKLNKNDENMDFMTTYKISRLDIYSDSQRGDGGDAQRKELEKSEEEIKEIMLQHGHLASDRLYNLIKKYQDLKPDWEQDNRFEAKKVLWEIQKITGERQDELRELILKN